MDLKILLQTYKLKYTTISHKYTVTTVSHLCRTEQPNENDNDESENRE